jgi:hypothetical protein
MPVWSEVEENACGCPWKTHAPHEQNDQNNVWKQSREVYNLKHMLCAGPVTKLENENDFEHVIGIQNYWVSGLCPSSGIVITRKQNFSETGSVSVLRLGQGDTNSVGSHRKS